MSVYGFFLKVWYLRENSKSFSDWSCFYAIVENLWTLLYPVSFQTVLMLANNRQEKQDNRFTEFATRELIIWIQSFCVKFTIDSFFSLIYCKSSVKRFFTITYFLSSKDSFCIHTSFKQVSTVNIINNGV